MSRKPVTLVAARRRNEQRQTGEIAAPESVTSVWRPTLGLRLECGYRLLVVHVTSLRRQCRDPAHAELGEERIEPFAMREPCGRSVTHRRDLIGKPHSGGAPGDAPRLKASLRSESVSLERQKRRSDADPSSPCGRAFGRKPCAYGTRGAMRVPIGRFRTALRGGLRLRGSPCRRRSPGHSGQDLGHARTRACQRGRRGCLRPR